MSILLGEKAPISTFTPPPRNEAWERAFPGVSNKDYHAWPELGSSRCKERLKSAAHFACEYSEESDDLDLGTCAHSLNLEGDSSIFVEVPEFGPISTMIAGARPGTEKKHTITAKAQMEEFQKKHEGKILLPAKTYAHLMGMHEVFLRNRDAQDLLKGAKVEVSYKYLDPATGLRCKFRGDILRDWECGFWDYKTAVSARRYEFEKAILRYGYHFSAAHYTAGARRVIKDAWWDFGFIAQEKKPPYAINIIPMSRRDLEKSLEFRGKVMLAIAKDIEAKSFPDYSAKREETCLPNYGFEFSA